MIKEEKQEYNKFIRQCPSCYRNLLYSRLDVLRSAEKRNVLCNSCGQKSRIYTEEFRHKMVEIYKNSSTEMKIKRMGMLNKLHSTETKNKMSSKAAGRIMPIEQKKKIGLSHLGKFISNETKTKLQKSSKRAWKIPHIRQKYYTSLQKTKWIRVRSDIGQLELLNKWNRLGFNFQPNYQLHIDDFLCYIDGYDPIHNIVLEYDGKYHQKQNQQQKDIIRQQKIVDILHPKKFWRYNAVNKQYKNILEKV